MNKPYTCQWSTQHELESHYHDTEWGVPVSDDHKHFEMLVLEGAQSGLSWYTILLKREGYRQAFAQFNPQKVARFTEENIQALLANSDIIRNRLKIQAAINNARCFIELQKEYGSFNDYIWSFIDFSPIDNAWQNEQDIPTSTPLSDTISQELKAKGFKFVGTTTIYAYMQAIGMVNDHVTRCFRYQAIKQLQKTFKQNMQKQLVC